jgi:hypothetical protein
VNPPITPDLDAARRRHLAWVQDFRLLRSPTKLEQYERWRMPELAALLYPDATGPDLDVMVDALGWFTLLDDQFDGSRRSRSAELPRLRGQLMACLAGKAPAHITVPLVKAWANLCPRMRAGMSACWGERLAATWANHFDACVVEEQLPADVETYLSVRRNSVGGHLGTVLLERALCCELPASLWDVRQIRGIRQGVADVAVLLNDIYSLPRELARRDRINMAILLQDQFGCSRAEAVDMILQRLQKTEASIVANQRELLACHPRLAATRRFIQGSGAIVSGLHEWYVATGRYAGPEIAADNAFGFEDLFAPGGPDDGN